MTTAGRIRSFTMWFATAGALLLSACAGRSFLIPTAPGFVELDDQEPSYDYRATTPDGVVVAVRQVEHKPKGDLAFWVQAVQNRLRDRGGYALIKSESVITTSGLRGTRLRFGHDEKGRAMRYDVTVFVTDSTIYVVEFGGDKAHVESQERYLTWVLANFRVT